MATSAPPAFWTVPEIRIGSPAIAPRWMSVPPVMPMTATIPATAGIRLIEPAPLRRMMGRRTQATPMMAMARPVQARAGNRSPNSATLATATISGWSDPSSDMTPAGIPWLTAHQLTVR